jgi:membrane-associated phospholipid phosphatase
MAWELRSDNPRLPALLAAMLAACTVVFSQLAEEVASGSGLSLDSVVSSWLHTHATELATTVMTAVTTLGGAQFLLVITGVAVAMLLLRRRVAHAAFVAAALAGGEALNWALKAAFERPRPWFSDPLATAGGFSFPSGHAMVSLTVYGALAFVVAASARSRRVQMMALGGAAALVLAIGFSRVYLGVHYVSDVAAAYCAGLAWLMICALMLLGASRRRARCKQTHVWKESVAAARTGRR